MGLFNGYQKEGRGVSKEEAASVSPVKRFFGEFAHRFWQIIVLNAVYLLACVPIVTIGPATAALNYVCRNFSQAKPVDFLTDFIEKCKEHFKQGFCAWLIQILVAGLAGVSFYFWTDPSFPVATGMKTFAAVVIFFVFYVLITASFYLYPMMVSFELPIKQLLRNSVILALTQLWRNLAMLAVSVVFTAAAALTFFGLPVLLPVLVFFAFSVPAYFNNALIYPVLKKYVAIPEETDEAEEEPASEQ